LGHNETVYSSPVESETDLEARVAKAAAIIKC
jgi:hypothetical protein